MADNQNRSSILAASIIAGCLLVGLSTAGYLIGRGTARVKSDVHSVVVKGLVKRA
jgi:hypothetical protein